MKPLLAALAVLTGTVAIVPAPAQAQAAGVLNLYSARHYQTDEALYEGFTKATGIRINRVDGDDAGILARLKTEGASSPADVILLVDAARLWRAEADGMLQPLRSATLEQRIPANLRGQDAGQGSQWFGLSTRARVTIYDKQKVKAEDVATYAQLADPKFKGSICVRSGSHPYNLSLFGSLMEHQGAQATETWLKGIVNNLARAPKGGDTDQIRAVAAGECTVAISNSYYLARLMRSNNPADRQVVERVGVVFPNQATTGTHMNISGGGIARNAPNRAAAVAFLEYLASDAAQRYFADGNNEWPAVGSVQTSNPALAQWGKFKTESVPISKIGMNQTPVQQMLDRVGFR
ncbi:MAG: extracellular solute-binding protein [Rubrivivax sp.]|jgi:iron(III) transport system substrate-binding protein